MRVTDHELWDNLWDELQRGYVYECNLRNNTHHLDWLANGINIYINPRPAIVETLIHELLHRMKPRWGEKRTTREARRLLTTMDEDGLRKWWQAYRRIRRIRRPLEVD